MDFCIGVILFSASTKVQPRDEPEPRFYRQVALIQHLSASLARCAGFWKELMRAIDRCCRTVFHVVESRKGLCGSSQNESL